MLITVHFGWWRNGNGRECIEERIPKPKNIISFGLFYLAPFMDRIWVEYISILYICISSIILLLSLSRYLQSFLPPYFLFPLLYFYIYIFLITLPVGLQLFYFHRRTGYILEFILMGFMSASMLFLFPRFPVTNPSSIHIYK